MGNDTPFAQSTHGKKPYRPTFERRKTDEGYNSCNEDDEKFTYESDKQNHHKPSNDHEIPIMMSTQVIHVSYTPFTYILMILIIGLYLHSLVTYPSVYLFPKFLMVTNILFHLAHIFAHTAHFTLLERFCVAYGTSIFWIGWILNASVFRYSVAIKLTFVLFWILMFERRNAWGIIMWEHLSHLDEDNSADMKGGQDALATDFSRLLAYRVWCLAGVGCMWELIYLTMAKYDGRPLIMPVFIICLLNILAGLALISWWSFWTFQYRAVIWRKELKDGIVVWRSSDGWMKAGEVQ